MIDEVLLFLAKKVGHAGGGEHIYIYICMVHFAEMDIHSPKLSFLLGM